MSGTRIPTIHDLRVKLCYICREEEHFDAPPDDPPRKWIHSCKCTLVAHESCLLKWIQTSQSDSRRASNALKCPQCGSDYEIISHKPAILRLLGRANRILQRTGRIFTVLSATGCLVIFGAGIYAVFTIYGAWAVRKFIGNEMFDILLTDDPSNWPWTAYLNLPSLTLSLILSRFNSRSASQIPSLIPLLLVWPPSTPVGPRFHLLDDYWTRPANANTFLAPGNDLNLGKWPPSPVIFGLFVVPVVRILYRRLFGKLQHWALGAAPPSAVREGAGWEWRLGEPFMIRIRMEEEVVEGQQQQQQQQQQQLQLQGQQDDAQGQQAHLPQVAPVEGGGEAEPAPNEAAVAAAEQLIEVDTSSLGRQVFGALLIPAISSAMGTLLSILSRRSRILRMFLGVRPPLSQGRMVSPPLGPYSYGKSWEGLGLVKKLGLGLKLVLGATWNGTRTWAEADPVWWRNSIGFGLFVVAKDCLQLLHLWLAKRELETRHVKDRDFASVDIRELDLIPSFPRNL